jgi:hypothetical protein
MLRKFQPKCCHNLLIAVSTRLQCCVHHVLPSNMLQPTSNPKLSAQVTIKNCVPQGSFTRYFLSACAESVVELEVMIVQLPRGAHDVPANPLYRCVDLDRDCSRVALDVYLHSRYCTATYAAFHTQHDLAADHRCQGCEELEADFLPGSSVSSVVDAGKCNHWDQNAS